ncbi:SOLUTE CARRIER FAMILY 22 MEMBER [Salix koriyanagi]|uniref:SOLUTE CARRIER FAMILY 22 MEMBER n=1 Tax=Salix koriyanagi TaxID=2511006 RepID=A0A9Q0SSN3_9ROSI|nr:SOLUTE CARRIER FAMILY 22 MEMBER [Salix koriyanagi]
MEETTPNPGHGNKQQLAERVASPAERNLELTVEAVVEEYVGSFGWSQFLHVLLVLIVWVFDSQNTLVAIFSDARPKSWRCINNSSSSLCMSSGSRGDVSSVCALKPGTWEWVGGHESSIVAEWGLVCGRRFLVGVPASMFFIGSLRGNENHALKHSLL